MLLRSSSTPIVDSLNSYISHRETVREVDFECDYRRSIRKTLACHCNFVYTEHANWTHCSRQHEHTEGNWDIERELIFKPRIRRAQSEGELTSLRNRVARTSFINPLLNSSVEGIKIFGDSSSSLRRHWSRCVSSALEVRYLILEGADVLACEHEKHEMEDNVNDGFELDQFLCSPIVDSGVGENEGTETIEVSHDKAQRGEYPVSSSVYTHEKRSAESLEVSVSDNYMRGFLMEDGEVYTSLSVGRNGQTVVCNFRGCRLLSESEKLSPMCIASGLELGKRGGYSEDACNSRHEWVFENDSNRTEAYYRNFLLEDPQNSLLLRNFAKFLYEVKRDYKMAEEYYERSILASPCDGEVLSQYAKLVWDVHRDEDRAETYYNQAVHAAPDDCYVLASYASFLWESEGKRLEDSLMLDTENKALSCTLQGPASVVAAA
eukprot:c28038_g3_i1 orf=295-1599(-)